MNSVVIQPKSPRPLSVTLLALGVLILGIINLVRLVRTIDLWSFFTALLPISPLYLALSGMIWSLVGAFLVWGLWRGLPWAPRVTILASLVYSLYYWIDRLFLAHGNHETNWSFILALNFVLLLWMVWIFNRGGSKAFFQ